MTFNDLPAEIQLSNITIFGMLWLTISMHLILFVIWKETNKHMPDFYFINTKETESK